MADDTSLLPPVFPPELERTIFEIRARAWPLSIPELMLVAHRVKIWLEPLLYRTVVMTDGEDVIEGHIGALMKGFMPVIQSKPPSFFKDSVHHLLLAASTPLEVANSVIAVCSGVEDLWINIDGPDLTTIGSLPLKRFYGHLMQQLIGGRINFMQRIFSQITHLEVFDLVSANELEAWYGLALIPHLTHLSFNWTNPLPLFPVLLDSCKSLQVLVLLEEHHADGSNRDLVSALSEDPRFVSMACENCILDWQMGAHTGIDYWWRAEEFIAKRRLGEINCLRYRIPEDESLRIR
ncbi:hypothetical protein C8R43DRAFT_18519 [Mycena crocata]|nr:hypothetical protein C8R43DRAFT_18519 [Mycena crocata]